MLCITCTYENVTPCFTTCALYILEGSLISSRFVDAPTGDCDQVFVARLQGLPFKASEEDIVS